MSESINALKAMLRAYAPDADKTAQAEGESALHGAVREARAAIRNAELSESEMIERGTAIASVLQIRKDYRTGRFNTAWGDKTELGLFLTVKRLVEEQVG